MNRLIIVEFDDHLYFSRDAWELEYKTDTQEIDTGLMLQQIPTRVNAHLSLGDKEIPIISIYDDNGVFGRLFSSDRGGTMIMSARSSLKEPNCEGWTKFAEGVIV